MNRINVRAIGAVVGAALLVAFVAPATVPSVGAAGTGVVDDFPLANQPRIMDGRVYAIVSSGTSVYVGGTFTTIRPASSSAAQIPQAYLFKFDVSTGVIDPTFRPVVDGEVEGLALTPDGAGLYVGGAFASINATTRTRLARLSTVDGAVDTSFTATAADRVKDLALRGNDLIVGGYFRKLNGVTRERLGALDAATGALRTAWNIPLTESRDGLGAFLQELDVSPDGEWMVVGGNFKSAGGLVRQQIAVVDLGDGTASVANWSTNRFVPQCSSSFKSTYIRGIDIAADSSWFVVNTTGAHFNGTLCDSASRWELPPTKGGPDVQPTWVTWTGTDTHWAVEVTGEAVYVGGHQRWENGPETWDGKSPGRVSRPGIAALDPTNGVPLSWNPGRDRGRGVEALLATDSYLFVGSDTTLFAGVNRQRLAVLPYAGGIQNPPPEAVELPVTLRVGMPDGTLRSLPYDGAVLGPSTTTSGPAIDGENWTTVRDAFVQRGQLTYFGSDFAYFRRAYDGVTFGPPTNLSTALGYIATNSPTQYNQPYNVSTVRDAGFSNGWMYYTHGSDSRLWSRGYSIESGIIGGQEMVASQADWSGSRGLEVVGEWLYAAWSDGRLYRYHLDGREVELGTRTMIDDGSLTGINWSQVGAFFVTPAGGVGYPPETSVTPPPPPCGGRRRGPRSTSRVPRSPACR
ncbi:MAG: delta-60 repeat domain-containing protein [Acidimicrobiia bacterium]|nr:delta-60 repeat domain-containing protein [Acidimicrobiia bacterium]